MKDGKSTIQADETADLPNLLTASSRGKLKEHRKVKSSKKKSSKRKSSTGKPSKAKSAKSKPHKVKPSSATNLPTVENLGV